MLMTIMYALAAEGGHAHKIPKVALSNLISQLITAQF